MNHIAEGILAAYSLPFFPTAVDVYFLEDFRDLPTALRKVRPTVFLGVPRVYEKLWESLERNPLGKLYLRFRQGTLKKIIGRALGRMVLRKAGLNRCGCFVVGSAPCGEWLLRNFQQLGIEVYNSYGLTEAPIVTINRPGANRASTVGDILPDTLVRIAEDGEVMVKGPQVMAGYYGDGASSPLRDGWLLTGDLGHVDPQGSLVLSGRKKELVVTSYGKKIFQTKIEAMLKEIPGVAEAMIVAEGKPFCSALLWLKQGTSSKEMAPMIQRRISEMARLLSHPEQVKCWALLPNDLSVGNGDLTPSLKLKRDAVLNRFGKVISACYDGSDPLGAIVHLSERR
jgi:long-chain acyl-CoA synthetase